VHIAQRNQKRGVKEKSVNREKHEKDKMMEDSNTHGSEALNGDVQPRIKAPFPFQNILSRPWSVKISLIDGTSCWIHLVKPWICGLRKERKVAQCTCRRMEKAPKIGRQFPCSGQ
jgi:hypothetical protein